MAEPRKIGNFELLEKIGQGGMGAVFKAHQVTMERVVAVKILPPKFAKQPKFIERFTREARASARLNHVNIVNGIDVGQEGGVYYFAMEYIKGFTVKEQLKKGPIPEARAVEITLAIARALAHAHKNGIVHRDVKPDNVLIEEESGTPKLCDLGVARMEEEDEAEKGLTHTGQAIGTPHYISPEQASGAADIDAKTDLYSLGAMLYHIVTGSTMFQGATSAVVMSKQISEKAVHPADLGVQNKAVVAVLAKLLTKDRNDRYASAEKLAEDLERLQRNEPPKNADLPGSKFPFQPAKAALMSAPKKTTATGLAPVGEKTARLSRRMGRRHEVPIGAILGGGAAVLVLLVVLSGVGGSSTPKPEKKPPPSKPVAANTPLAMPTPTPPPIERPPVNTEPTVPVPSPDTKPLGILPTSVEPANLKPETPDTTQKPEVAPEPPKPVDEPKEDFRKLIAHGLDLAKDAKFDEAADLLKTLKTADRLSDAEKTSTAARAAGYAGLAELKTLVADALKKNPGKLEAEQVFRSKRVSGKLVGADDKGILARGPNIETTQPWSGLTLEQLKDVTVATLEKVPPSVALGLAVVAWDRGDEQFAVDALREIASTDPNAKIIAGEIELTRKQKKETETAAKLEALKKAVQAAWARSDGALQAGLLGEYYGIGQRLTSFATLPSDRKLTTSQVDAQINFAMTQANFAGTGLNEQFCVCWTGVLRVAKAGRYKFFTDSGDGSRLYLDGKLVVDNDGSRRDSQEKEGETDLGAGDHPLKLDFFYNKGGAACKLSWQGDGIEKQIVPAAVLFHKGAPGPATSAPAPTPSGPASEDAWKQAVNLKALIDPKRDAVAGFWKIQNGAVVSDKAKPAVLQIPYRPPEEYDFRIVFTRVEGNCEVVQILSRLGRAFDWMMGGWSNTVFGFEMIDNLDAEKNPTAVKSKSCLENNRQYTAFVQVRKTSIAAYLDGNLIRKWTTDYTNLRANDQLRLRDENLLGIGSWESIVTFHSIELLEITGKGTPTR
jgi:serine/threonine-protein kinase